MKTTDEIFKKAYKDSFDGRYDIEGYELLEMHLYLTLRDILKAFQKGYINNNMASILKNSAFKEYNDKVKNYQFRESIIQERVKFEQDTCRMRMKYAKEAEELTQEIKDKGYSPEILDKALKIIDIYNGKYKEFENESKNI